MKYKITFKDEDGNVTEDIYRGASITVAAAKADRTAGCLEETVIKIELVEEE